MTNQINNNSSSGINAILAEQYDLLYLAACSLIFLGLGLGQDGINLDSTTYSVIARNMVENGNWFDPHYTKFYHQHFAEHPVLAIYGEAIMFLIFGITDTTARFFGAFCTMGSVLMVYLIGRDAVSRNAGLISGIILLLSYNFMQLGNTALLDVPMSFFLLVTLWLFARQHKFKPTMKRNFLIGLFLGLTFLTKGVVSAPLWCAIGLTVILYKRDWLKSFSLYLIPIVSLTLIGLYLWIDYLATGGHFSNHYFLVQLGRSTVSPPVGAYHTEWWEFTYRYFSLYLPFCLLVPVGIVLSVRKKMITILPITFSLLVYAILFSMAPKIYYHYFCVTYALSAPLVGLAISQVVKERGMKRIQLGFASLWICAAIIVVVSGIRIHEIRSAEIYNNNQTMTTWLDQKEDRDGLILCEKRPDWDYVAKSTWYWNSDLSETQSWTNAIERFNGESGMRYILAPKGFILPYDSVTILGLTIMLSNEKYTIYH